MEKLVKKEQCIAALTAAGISEESAKKINDIQDDAADCIYRYAMTSAFFACDEIVDLCINAVQEQTEYPSKNILYIIQALANAKLNPDVISQFIMSHIHSRFDDLRREAYALIRTSTCTSVEETLTAILSNAAYIMLAHNHPSGNIAPSEEDVRITDRMNQICRLMDIPLIEHIIISDNRYFSFNQHEMLQQPELKFETDYTKIEMQRPRQRSR